MKQGTKWKLTRRKGRKYWVCRYMLAGESEWTEETTKKTRKREAESVARSIVSAAEEREGLEIKGWSEFRARYESEHLSGSPSKTLQAFQTAANRLELLCKPQTVDALDADMFSRFALRLRAEPYCCSPATIQAYRDHLMSALKWAKAIKIIAKRPEPPPLPGKKSAKKARGRQISREEAERIVQKLPEVVGAMNAKRWAWNLEGLWRSGFRIGETLLFYWEPTEGMHYIENLDGDRPRIVIDASGEKGQQDRTIPMAPDFAAMLRAVDPKKRRGPVFRWQLSRGDTQNAKTIGKRISQAGELAGVVVGKRMRRTKNKDGTINVESVPQFATAHTFRAAFGARWAPKVMPIVLKVMMRHQSIETTLRFYVGLNADRTGDAMWNVQGAVLGDMFDSLESITDLGEEFSTANNV